MNATLRASLVTMLFMTACPSDTMPGSGGSETGGAIDPSTTSSPATTATPADSSGGGGGTAAATSTGPAADGTTQGAESSSGGGSSDGGNTGGIDNPPDCGGADYQCVNGVDDDGDGLIDLDDPECTGPCDDDEGSFQTGLPGDNMDCKQDCFFDGNSGQGDDGCIWDLNCDPANPGAAFGCPYTGGMSCVNLDPPSKACLMACQGLVPPGCDCFGCCTVQTPEGPVDIFLNSSEDCALDNLAACGECTQSDLCVNTCEPEICELCFGETELPKGCTDAMCEVGTGQPCMDNGDCNLGEYCYLGCCYPAPAP